MPNFTVRILSRIRIPIRPFAPFVEPILPETGMSLTSPTHLLSRRSIFLSSRSDHRFPLSRIYPRIPFPLTIMYYLSLRFPPYPDPENLQTERTRNECVQPSQSNQREERQKERRREGRSEPRSADERRYFAGQEERVKVSSLPAGDTRSAKVEETWNRRGNVGR